VVVVVVVDLVVVVLVVVVVVAVVVAVIVVVVVVVVVVVDAHTNVCMDTSTMKGKVWDAMAFAGQMSGSNNRICATSTAGGCCAKLLP